MDDELKVEQILGGIRCPKNLQCCESGFVDICRAEDVGLDSFLKCLEGEPRDCVYSIGYGENYYCKCPLRVYIAKHLKK
jgi:hypothetical protein